MGFLISKGQVGFDMLVDASVKKLLKTGKELDDALLAAVIRNLKVVPVCNIL